MVYLYLAMAMKEPAELKAALNEAVRHMNVKG